MIWQSLEELKIRTNLEEKNYNNKLFNNIYNTIPYMYKKSIIVYDYMKIFRVIKDDNNSGKIISK